MNFTERFWAKVDKSGGEGACWPWLGAISDTGYGKFRSDGGRVGSRALRAPRVAWELVNGPIPDGLWTLHSCDNRQCVNPAHLRLGNRSDNMRDMWERGRQGTTRAVPGEKNGMAKLTAAAVVEIRARRRQGEALAAIARDHGVHLGSIHAVVTGKTWRHV